MVCSNCYTGCVQIYSDKCVKYTGLNNELLGVQTGDSINFVVAATMGYLVTALDGTGIIYSLGEENLCETISQYLPDSENINVIHNTRALAKAICDISDNITEITSSLEAIEEDYVVPECIDAENTDGTHAILNATMEKVCENTTEIDATKLDLSTNYIAISDIDNYIADWVANNLDSGGATGYASRMVPYAVVEYYGSLTHFDMSGAGTGDWTNIYLCNGNNGTPDKRGRIPVGTTSGMGGGAFSPVVDPGVAGNPSYSLYSTGGANNITLTDAQIPSHTHTGVTSTTGAHTHNFNGYIQSGSNDGSGGEVAGYFGTKTTESSGSHSHTFTTSAVGGGGSHSNIPPVLACHYIMYIPAP